MSSRLPALGPRGEGWVVAQFGLFAIIAIAGLRDLVGYGSVTPWGRAVSVVGIVAIVVGGGLAARGIWDLRSGLSPFPRPTAGAPLIESGAYRLIRHPIYSGLVLGAIGWGLVNGLHPGDRGGRPAVPAARREVPPRGGLVGCHPSRVRGLPAANQAPHPVDVLVASMRRASGAGHFGRGSGQLGP